MSTQDEANQPKFSEDGYLIGPYGEELGYCNSCGEERAVTEDCCEDGEIDPPREEDWAQ